MRGVEEWLRVQHLSAKGVKRSHIYVAVGVDTTATTLGRATVRTAALESLKGFENTAGRTRKQLHASDLSSLYCL